MRLLKVTIVSSDIDDAGDSAAVTRRERAFVQRDFLHGLRLEDREQTKHVFGVVKRDSVQKQQVFVRATPAHVYSRKAFRSALHSRHQLDGLKDIGLAEEDGGVPDHVQGNLYGAHLRGHDSGFPLRRDNRFLELGVRLQGDVDGGVAHKVDCDSRVIIPDVGIFQRDLPALWNRQGVESVVVCGRAGSIREHTCSDQCLAGGLVRDVSAHGYFRPLALGVQVPGEGQRQQPHRNCGCDQSVKIIHNQKSFVN